MDLRHCAARPIAEGARRLAQPPGEKRPLRGAAIRGKIAADGRALGWPGDAPGVPGLHPLACPFPGRSQGLPADKGGPARNDDETADHVAFLCGAAGKSPCGPVSSLSRRPASCGSRTRRRRTGYCRYLISSTGWRLSCDYRLPDSHCFSSGCSFVNIPVSNRARTVRFLRIQWRWPVVCRGLVRARRSVGRKP